VRWTPKELPNLANKVKDEEQAALAMVLSNCRHWLQMGLPPVTYADLVTGTHSPGDGLDALRYAIGDTIWKKAYPAKVVTTLDWVPSQFASIVTASSEKLHQDTAALINEAMTEKAEEFFGQLADAHEKTQAEAFALIEAKAQASGASPY
jgi:hypothetical protein